MALNNETIKETPYNPSDNGQSKATINAKTLAADAPRIIEQIKNTQRPIFSGNEALPLSGFMILGGAPGSGKTSLAMKMALNAAMQGNPVFMLSYEMPVKQTFARFLQIGTRTKLHDLMYNEGKEDALKHATKELEPALQNIRVTDTSDHIEGENILPWRFEATKKQLNEAYEATGKMPYILVDSIQAIPLSDEMQGKTQKEKVDFVIEKLYALSTETGAAVLGISQGNRSQNKSETGKLFGFSGSGKIEYAADTVYIVEVDGELRTLKALKNRYGEKDEQGIELQFDGEFTDFPGFDYDKDLPNNSEAPF